MTRSGGGLRTWGSLVLLGLCCWTGTRAAGPKPVRNLRVEARTNSSITLTWEVPEGLNPQNCSYWVQWTGQSDINETRNTTDTSFTVDGLDPGSLYEFFVWVEEDGVNSPQETLKATTAPNPIRNLRVETQTNSSVTLNWEDPDSPNTLNYIYWVQWSGDGVQNKTQNTTITHDTVAGLKAAFLYEFSVWAEKHGVPGSRTTLRSFTAPNAVRKLSVEAQTTSSIILSWEVPDGPDLLNYKYWVQWTRDGDKPEIQSTTNTRVTLEGLKPGSLYELSVWAEKNAVNSSWETLNVATAPNAVRKLSVEAQTTSSIILSWEVPDGPDLLNYKYWVQWTRDGDKPEIQSTTNTRVTLEGLKPGSLYELSVWAEKNAVNSFWETLNAATAPNAVRKLCVEAQTTSSIILSWEVPDGPDLLNYKYWVQWTRDGDKPEIQSTTNTSVTLEGLKPGSLYELSVWAEKNAVNSSWETLNATTGPDPVTITSCTSTSGGYGIILTWSCPTGGYEAFELKVGGQQILQDRSSCEREVSVSGLQPAQSYPATVTTIWDTMRAQPASMTCHTESAGVIAGAIVGVLLFLVLAGLLVFFLKRYKKSQEKSAPQDLVLSFPGDILADDFADHVRKNEKDSNCGFAEEYQRLALGGHNQSQRVASAPENSAKNRYRNVLPYDWSRVPLMPVSGEPGSDYINASFMPGPWSSKEFIAAQGPLPQTVGDFWRLVWEQQSHTLVMLTNCVEFGRVKCEHYWPLDTQPCTYGHLQVTLNGEKVMENWTIRDLKLQHMREQKMLHVRQFHYVAWPDHGVPHSPDPLLAFWKVLRQWLDQSPGEGPPIVHCSAGVGRTGTLIALDVLLRQLEAEGLVRPFSYVRKMRESRPLMVQTEAQYVFLHQCILRFLQQSSPATAKKGAIYENLLFENEAAIQAQ